MDNCFWFRIDNNLKITKIENPQKGTANTLYFIKFFWENRTHTTSYNNTYKMYEIEFLNEILKPVEFYIGNFKIHSAFNSFSWFGKERIDFQFIDCSGTIVEKIFYVSLIDNFEEAINFLVIRKHCNTFKEYDLEQKIIELEGKVNKFEDKLSQIKEITLSTLKLLE